VSGDYGSEQATPASARYTRDGRRRRRRSRRLAVADLAEYRFSDRTLFSSPLIPSQ